MQLYHTNLQQSWRSSYQLDNSYAL